MTLRDAMSAVGCAFGIVGLLLMASAVWQAWRG